MASGEKRPSAGKINEALSAIIDETQRRGAENSQVPPRQVMVNRIMTKKQHEMFVEEIQLLAKQAGLIDKIPSGKSNKETKPEVLQCLEEQVQRFEDSHRLAFYKAYVSQEKDTIYKNIHQVNDEEEEKI